MKNIFANFYILENNLDVGDFPVFTFNKIAIKHWERLRDTALANP